MKKKAKNRKKMHDGFDDLIVLGFMLIDKEGNYIDPVEYFNLVWE